MFAYLVIFGESSEFFSDTTLDDTLAVERHDTSASRENSAGIITSGGLTRHGRNDGDRENRTSFTLLQGESCLFTSGVHRVDIGISLGVCESENLAANSDRHLAATV